MFFAGKRDTRLMALERYTCICNFAYEQTMDDIDKILTVVFRSSTPEYPATSPTICLTAGVGLHSTPAHRLLINIRAITNLVFKKLFK